MNHSQTRNHLICSSHHLDPLRPGLSSSTEAKPSCCHRRPTKICCPHPRRSFVATETVRAEPSYPRLRRARGGGGGWRGHGSLHLAERRAEGSNGWPGHGGLRARWRGAVAVSRPQRPVPGCARWLWRLAGPHLGVPALAGDRLRLTNAWRGSPGLSAPWRGGRKLEDGGRGGLGGDKERDTNG